MANQDASITISVIAKDLASGNIGKAVSGLDALAKKGGLVGSMAQGVGQSFGQMINPVMLAGRAIGAVTDFLQEGIKSAIEEEASLKRLDTALENNVDSWDGSHAAIEEDIEAKMRLGFQDDALRESMIKLVTATGNQEEAMRLNGLAMDIARAKGIELSAATDLVVKANMGNVGALRRAGIAIDKNATKTEILAKLTETYAGQAETYADTTAGAMEAAQVAIGEVGEDIGAMLIPIIGDAAKAITDDLLPAIRHIATVWNDTIGAIEGYNQATKDATESRLLDQLAVKLNITREAAQALWDTEEQRQPAVVNLWGQQIDMVTRAQLGYGDLADAAADASAATATIFSDPIPGVAAIDHAMTVMNTRLTEGGTQMAAGVKSGFAAGWPNVVRLMDAAALEAKTTFEGSGRAIGADLAGELKDSKDVVKTAMDDLMWAIKHPMKLTKEVARIEGALISRELRDGLASNNPMIANIAAQQKNLLIEQWEKLTGIAYNDGTSAANALERGLRNFNPVAIGRPFTGSWTNGTWRLGGRAEGGPVQAGTPYIVGEKRAELFVPDQSGTILPSVPAASSNVTLSVTIQSYVPPSPSQAQAAAQAILPGLVREMRRQQLLPSH